MGPEVQNVVDVEQAALRERLGKGARYDAESAPTEDLLLARRGTAYFARKLNELSDEDLDGASLIPGWSRRHLIAHVGLHARAMALVTEGVRSGEDLKLHASDEERDQDVVFTATLPSRALRHLFRHSEVHLNVEWRDLTNEQWCGLTVHEQNPAFAIRRTPLQRARMVWLHAIDLNNGGRFSDLPPSLADDLLSEQIGELSNRPDLNFSIDPTDGLWKMVVGSNGGEVIMLPAAELLAWTLGRRTRGVMNSRGEAIPMPIKPTPLY